MAAPRGTLFLVGFMGSGKSSVGAHVAARLGYEFEDTDVRVEESEGCPIEQIFRTWGEGRFREAEWRVLKGLEGRRRLVVATGGGLFPGVAPRRFMKCHGTTVWLDVSLEVARQRLGAGEGRPLWVPEDPFVFRAFFEKRRAAYALADVRVDASRDAPEVVAGRLLERLRALDD